MALRKALAYSHHYARPNTRTSRVKGKAYIKVVPHNKVVKYNLGNQKAHMEGKFPLKLTMISEEAVQIRDNAIEAARMLLTKQLDERLPLLYYLELKVHPHHILRNNKTAAGAGADRLSSGMSRSFGTVEGRAALVSAGKPLFVIYCADEAAARIVRETFAMTKSKLPCATRVVFEKITKPIAVA